MSFYDDLLFPPAISYGATGGPGFGNVVQSTPSGLRAVIQRQAEGLGRWDISLDRPPKEMSELQAFARITHGSLHGFRLIDFNDFTSAPDGLTTVSSSDSTHRHAIGTGDGTTTRFPISKTYTFGSRSISRRLRKPMRLSEATEAADYFESGPPTAASSMHFVWQDGTLKTLSTHYSIDYETGEAVFVTAPTSGHVVEWAGYFCVPVRFSPESDQLIGVTRQSRGQSTTPTLGLVEDIVETAMIFPWRDPGGSTTYTAGASEAQVLVQWSMGAHVRINPDAASASPLPVKLPAEAEWMRGGPLFTIANSGASDSIALQNSAGAAIVTIAPGEIAQVWLSRDSAGTGWYWLTA